MSPLGAFATHEDLHQSASYARIMDGIGWASVPVSGSRISVRRLGPLSLAKMQRPRVIDIPKLLALRKKLLMVYLVIEPALQGVIIDKQGTSHSYDCTTPEGVTATHAILRAAGLRVTRTQYAHSKTAIIDLSKPLADVIAAFPQKARYNMKLSQKKGVTYSVRPLSSFGDEDRARFFVLHDAWSKEKNVHGYTDAFLKVTLAAFAHDGVYIQAEIDGTLAGGMFVLIHDGVAYYFYTCTSKEGRERHVPTGLLYEALKVAYAHHCAFLDFCSVYDERYPEQYKRWQGFTVFKDRFHPIPVYYPQTVARWLL